MNDPPRIMIVTRGGPEAGLGHVRRSATLARALHRRGAAVAVYVDGDHEGRVALEGIPMVEAGAAPEGVVKAALEMRPAMVIIDAKGMPHGEALALRAAAGRLGVIDDLGDRAADADLIINGTVYADELPYRRKPAVTLLLGPQYALLRESFASEPRRTYPPRVRRVLVTVGGVDPTGLTPGLIRWTREACPDAVIAAVVGPYFRDVEAVREASPDELLTDPPDIHGHMLAADLAISGGGQTTYELAATATPTLGVRIGEDQARNLDGLSRKGTLVHVGGVADPALGASLQAALRRLAGAAAERERMGWTARRLVDGRGAERVANEIINFISSLEKQHADGN